MTEVNTLSSKEVVPVNIEDYAMTTEKVVRQVNLIQEVMTRVMHKDEHYGVIPGTKKPTLLKAGAEKLSHTFRFATAYEIRRADLSGGHREYEIVCKLTHMPTGMFVAEGVGSCSTMESRYRYRKADQKCPKCGKEAIIKGKQEYGGGWLCFAKKGGCGAKFKDGDPAIENMDMGRVEYSDPADYYNTCLKIAKKRAHVDAVLTATAASDIFTQDVEDLPPEVLNNNAPPPAQEAVKKPRKTTEDDQPAGCTGAQSKKIFAVSMEHGLSREEATKLVEWWRKGDKLTKQEASALIEKMENDFDNLVDDYMASQVSDPVNP